MSISLYPLRFRPYLKSVIWGGEKIAPYKGLATGQTSIGESWEISGVPGHESVVAQGSLEGRTLPSLIDEYRDALVGDATYRRFGSTFPLLVKIIDAKGDLSVQVHPNDDLARRRHGSFGKTEMWYIIDADPGAKIYAGLARHITPQEYTEHVAEKTIMADVACHDSHPGDVFFLPAGRIHAIGAGNLLAEIQQTSDITYRVYDFDRRDADGNPRQLHTEEARDAIDYNVYPDYLTAYDRRSPSATLVGCDYFTVSRLIVDGTANLPAAPGSFTILMVIDGELTIRADDAADIKAVKGETILVPACFKNIGLQGQATILTATNPIKN